MHISNPLSTVLIRSVCSPIWVDSACAMLGKQFVDCRCDKESEYVLFVWTLSALNICSYLDVYLSFYLFSEENMQYSVSLV